MDEKDKKKPKKQTVKKKKITFVCTGNTCRSAMAKYIFADFLKKKKLSVKYSVDSAGINAFGGDAMTINAQKALGELKISYTEHKAKKLTNKLIEKSELIVCMTAGHKDALKPLNIDLSKCVTIKELTGGNEVFDPYGQDLSVYIQTAEYLTYSMEEIIKYIENR